MESLIKNFKNLLSLTPLDFKRYLYSEIAWGNNKYWWNKKWEINYAYRYIFIVFIMVGLCSCGRKTSNSNFYIEDKENTVVLDDKEKLPDCENFGNKQNPLYGRMYKDIEDIPELKSGNDDTWGERVILASEDSNGFYQLGISYFVDDKKNVICLFNKYVIINSITHSKILDTINIGKLKDREHIILNCIQNGSIMDSEIIAVVRLQEGKNFYEVSEFKNIVKAWRADTKTGIIKPIENVKGIRGINDECYD